LLERLKCLAIPSGNDLQIRVDRVGILRKIFTMVIELLEKESDQIEQPRVVCMYTCIMKAHPERLGCSIDVDVVENGNIHFLIRTIRACRV